MTTHSSARAIGYAGALGLLSLVAACGSSTQPSDNGGNTPAGDVSLTLKVQGLTGSEQFMEVDYNVGSTLLTRQAASVAAVRAQMTRCESGTQSTFQCTANVPVGSTVSFFAVENSDGVAEPTPGQTAIPGTPAGDVEFVNFTGCTILGGVDSGGDCSLTAKTGVSETVTANFSNMNALAFEAEGAGVFSAISVQARAQLSMPAQPNGIPSGTGTNSFIIGNAPVPEEVVFLPTGSTASVSAFPTGLAGLIGWKGPCAAGGGGGGATCTLTEPAPGSAPTVATALLTYWNCGPGDFADGPSFPGCVMVSPSLVRINPSRTARR